VQDSQPSNYSITSCQSGSIMDRETPSARTVDLQRLRDNIIYVLHHEELSDEQTLRLETQLSSVEDELVFLRVNEAV
jgi:hypothetical protein